MAHLPTLLFIPGAWHKPTCYSKIIGILEQRLHTRCISITLPSTAGDRNATFKDDLDVARAALASETQAGRNVVVIAHSYGGMVGCSAIRGFARPHGNIGDATAGSASSNLDEPANRTQNPPKGYVVGLILIASGFTLTGFSFMDPFFGIPPPTWRVNKESGFAELVKPPGELFYHDVPADEANEAISQLTPQSLKALFEGGEYSYAGWTDVPCWYIGTTQDRGLPVVVQRVNVGMAREMGGCVEHREVGSGHSPFLSMPDKVMGIVVEAVETFTGLPVDGSRHEVGEDEKVGVPAAGLWSPSTWLRFGLPLTFGHALGRYILIFGWLRGLFATRSAYGGGVRV
ncbi:alpha/beta-hydrolase [Setomelanomma holmii]|uniref:Alpha/beta-hydrolase n=1 Tax=Setomelanomma holmii TaxID=210430 RepID=A0A9P4LIA1_9PLEO|nr:alpha/beta-hydrolase [Setomelanomma holmii]